MTGNIKGSRILCLDGGAGMADEQDEAPFSADGPERAAAGVRVQEGHE